MQMRKKHQVKEFRRANDTQPPEPIQVPWSEY